MTFLRKNAFAFIVFLLTLAAVVWHYERKLEEADDQSKAELSAVSKETRNGLWLVCSRVRHAVDSQLPDSAEALSKTPFGQDVLKAPFWALYVGFASAAVQTMGICLYEFAGLDDAQRLTEEFNHRFSKARVALGDTVDPHERAQAYLDVWHWFLKEYEAKVTKDYVFRKHGEHGDE